MSVKQQAIASTAVLPHYSTGHNVTKAIYNQDGVWIHNFKYP